MQMHRVTPLIAKYDLDSVAVNTKSSPDKTANASSEVMKLHKLP